MFLYVNTDGGCIDNTQDPPGLASCAYVIRGEDSAYLGSRSDTFQGTNNDAEYKGVLLALGDLHHYDKAEGAQIRCDSELVVNQILGNYRCKDPRMKVYLQRVRKLLEDIPFHCSFKCIKRKANGEADWLCTNALYRGPKTDRLSPLPIKVTRDRLKKEAKVE